VAKKRGTAGAGRGVADRQPEQLVAGIKPIDNQTDDNVS
jgi:hypothetical protein